jgi:WD40 repeat protein
VLRRLAGPTRQVSHLAYSPDGRWLASGCPEGIGLWDAATLREVRIFGSPGSLIALAFAPDGRLVSSVSGGPVQVWDPATGREVLRPAGHHPVVGGVAFSPDGKRLAAVSDGQLDTWDAATGQRLLALQVPKTRFTGLAYSPDGRLLAASGVSSEPGQSRSEVRLWDAATGKEERTFPWPAGLALAVAFRPDGRLLAASGPGNVKAWDLAGGKEVFTRQLDGAAPSLAFSPDGGGLAVAGVGDATRVWDLAGGRERFALGGKAASLAFSPDGRLVSAGEKETKLWDVATGQALYTFPLTASDLDRPPTRPAGDLAFSPDGGQIASSAGDGLLQVWDARPLTPERKVEREALGLLDQLFSRPLPRQEVLEAIRTHPALGEGVRQQALRLAEHYREEEDPRRYAAAARALARRDHLPEAWYRQALRQAEAAGARAPEAGYCLTALAQYRLGRFAEALATLDRPGPSPPDAAALALLALAHHQLGHPEEAAASLARLRDLMKDGRGGQDEEAQALRREAELRVEGKAPP